MSKYDAIADQYAQTIDLFNDLDCWIYENNLPSKRSKILDIGCGTGSILEKLSRLFDEVNGIDISKLMLEKAKLRLPQGKFVVHDGNELPYPDGYFDMVISHAAFHYLDRNLALKEATRVLSKSGKLVIAEVVKVSPFKKYFEKLIFRSILTHLRLLIRYGLIRTQTAWHYVYSNEWQNLADKNLNNLSDIDFKGFYSHRLPGAKFGIANYRVRYFVWEKP